jgi:hypothetical protein
VVGNPRGIDPSRVWNLCGAEAQQGPRDREPSGALIWLGAVARHSPRCREPSGAEQELCGPMGSVLGRPAVLLLDMSMESLP